MILYPNYYYQNVQSVELERLKKDNILGIILDVDNTLIDYEQNMPLKIMPWVKRAKEMGFKMVILSNSNQKSKVSKVARKLKIEYITSAKKPFKFGFKNALKSLDILPQFCVAIGDQIFTDVIGANMLKINSCYVEPINRKKEYWYTSWKRPIEDMVINCYKKSLKGS